MPNLIDLTRTLVPAMPVYPGDPGFESETVADYAKDGFFTSRWTMVSHLGTHLDAPLHYVPQGIGVDRLPLETFYGPATLVSLVDVLKKVKGRPARITPAILERFSPAFEKVERIVVQTGWEKRFGDKDYFTAFPSLTREAAQWIVDRKMKLLGFDTPSVSSVRAEGEDSANDDAVCHRILLRNKPPVVILEGLVNLDELPRWPKCFTLSCFPWKVQDGDGCPVRAVAILD